MFIMIGYFCSSIMASSCQLAASERAYPTLDECGAHMALFKAAHPDEWGGAACMKVDLGEPS